MILLRRVLGDALRARRQAQHRTLREVSGAANVSLGYLSEIERGQKEASSELLSAICDALGAQLSEVLRDVSETMEFAELTEAGVLTPRFAGPDGERFERPDDGRFGRPEGDGRLTRATVGGRLSPSGAGAAVLPVAPADEASDAEPAIEFAAAEYVPREAGTVTNVVGDGGVSVAVRHDGPLKTTLRATRTGKARRDVVRAA